MLGRFVVYCTHQFRFINKYDIEKRHGQISKLFLPDTTICTVEDPEIHVPYLEDCTKTFCRVQPDDMDRCTARFASMQGDYLADCTTEFAGKQVEYWGNMMSRTLYMQRFV